MNIKIISNENILYVLILMFFFSPTSFAMTTTLNFSAILSNATCSISLDKSALSLGDVSLGQLRKLKYVSAEPFKLSIRDCLPISSGTYSVTISGNGNLQDGRWLFKNQASETGVGIMIIQSDKKPDFSSKELKNGDIIPFGKEGVTPTDQDINFYAGASCGENSGCSKINLGEFSATVMFDLFYR